MDLARRWLTHPSDFAWTTAYHRANPILRRTNIAVGLWCQLYAVCCLLVAHTPAGIGAPLKPAAGYLLAAVASVVGVAWILGPWPNEAVSRLFAVYLEVSAATVLMMLMDSMAALPCAAALVINGNYIAAFHSPRLFLGHQCWAIAVSTVLFVRAVTAPDADVVWASSCLVLLTLILFSSPILTQSLLMLLRRDAAAAFFDPLTGLRNRRGVEAALTAMLPETDSATFIAIDIDHFKQINDQFGHARGDAVLRDTAASIQNTFPSPSICARTGGEEFAVITIGDPAAALASAEGLRIALARGSDPVVTVSIGIVHTSTHTLAASFEQVCSWADAAMYAAKRAGGDTIVVDTRADDAG